MEAADEEATPALLHVPDMDIQGLVDMQLMVAEVGTLFE
jgi:hypothetical protein